MNASRIAGCLISMNVHWVWRKWPKSMLPDTQSIAQLRRKLRESITGRLHDIRLTRSREHVIGLTA